MKYRLEIGESDLRRLVLAHIAAELGIDLPPEAVKIEVKSKQNWKSEWEAAGYRVIVEGDR
jgi:hypothetical protein